MVISYEMGAAGEMSTPEPVRAASEAHVEYSDRLLSMHRLSRFSGKLSPVMLTPEALPPSTPPADAHPAAADADPAAAAPPAEIGGRDGPEPTRFGDWELRGRCIDF
jgi:hypothetical protein